ncbi:MAG: DUF2911 domain-containing protein [Bacteroidetes bacterium]|nr:DUF2911 domain-containing protein [Bacteroidota bacterium]
MKNLLLIIATFLMAMSTSAQTLPKPSPLGTNSQVVGVTSVSFEYSRPGVKDREIFGGLLAYGELWRFGANSATKFTIDTDIKFEEGILAAGSYAMFAIPNKDMWTIIFNKDTKQSGTESYSQDLDALRVKVKAMENSFTETFTLGVDNVRNDGASLVMLWDKTKLEIPFTVETNKLAEYNIQEAEKKGENLADVYGNAANFYYGTLKDYNKALAYADKSIKLGENYRNVFMKARILKELGNTKEATTLATKALDLATKEDAKGYMNFISGTLDSWK